MRGLATSGSPIARSPPQYPANFSSESSPDGEVQLPLHLCYEDFLIGAMKERWQVASSACSIAASRASELSINWFGGEPLAARKIVLRLSSHASRLCKEHGVILRGGLTTNAYLLNFDLFEELVSYDQRFFQITFDGWSEGHDTVRKLAGGGGTFDRIWRNLEATRGSAQDFDILIRMHVRRDNFGSIETLVDNVARTSGTTGAPGRFRASADLGGEGGKSVAAAA